MSIDFTKEFLDKFTDANKKINLSMKQIHECLKNSIVNYDQTIKNDFGKLKLSLTPGQIIKDIAEVREYGIQKYGDSESWREVALQRYIDAAYRHFLAFVEDNNSIDDESNLPHYKHLACNMAFICEMLAEKNND